MMNVQGSYGLECIGSCLCLGDVVPPNVPVIQNPAGILTSTGPTHGSGGSYTFTTAVPFETARTVPLVIIAPTIPSPLNAALPQVSMDGPNRLITVLLGAGGVNARFFLVLLRLPNP